MEINYNNFPSVLFTSFRMDDAPEELPFEVEAEQTRQYLAQCKGFQEMFTLITIKNTEKEGNSNLHFALTENLFHKIDSDDYFRNRLFGNFLTTYIKPKNGTILFNRNCQYVYLLLGEKDTKKLKKVDGRYIAVALFSGNHFIGFEEGIIIKGKGIQVSSTGHYAGGMDLGGYISFVLITLAYAGDTQHSLLETDVKENIYQLE